MRTKRALALSGLIGMLAALAFAATASAADVDRLKGACVTEGTARLNRIPPLTGGAGSYQFDDLIFTCVGVELSKGTNVAIGLIVLDVTSPGNWTSLVCGTGKAVSGNAIVHGSVTTALVGTPKTDTTAEWQTIANALDYTVEFVAYQGVLKWTDPSGQKLSVDVPKLLTPGPTGYPGGVVDIVPDPLGGTVPCARNFLVTAALTIDYSPANPIF